MNHILEADYSNLGRIKLRIEVVCDNHDEAIDLVGDQLSSYKKWYNKNKEKVDNDLEKYRKLLVMGPELKDKDDIERAKAKLLSQGYNPYSSEVLEAAGGSSQPPKVDSSTSNSAYG